MIEGVLGVFPFTVTPVEIATFDNLRQSRKIQYVQHKTMLDRPRVQHVGRELVSDCLHRCKELGFRVLQFNAVVADNIPALALYKSLGFAQLGVIPGGFRKKDGTYADIIPHYFDVTKL